jgi:hypothetical protein
LKRSLKLFDEVLRHFIVHETEAFLLFIIMGKHKKTEVYDDVQDVCCDKLDMFYICELQTMSVELVHHESALCIHEKAWRQEKFSEQEQKVFNTEREHGAEGEKWKREITME